MPFGNIGYETEYLLVGAYDALQITADIHMAGYYSIDVDRLAANVFAEPVGVFLRALTEEFLRWYEHASPVERAHICIAGLLESSGQFESAINRVATRIVQSHYVTIGTPNLGYPEAFARHIVHDPALPFPLATKEEAIRRETIEAALDDPLLKHWSTLMLAQHARAVESIRAVSVEEYLTFARSHYQTIRDRIDRNVSRFQERRALEFKKSQRVLKKGIRLARALFPKLSISSFLTGGGMIVNGVIFDYHLSNPDLMHQIGSGHIPYDLKILSKDKDPDKEGAQPVLGSGCIVFQDTPVLDQMIALCLHVRDKETELLLLDKMNIMATVVGMRNETLLELKPKLKEREEIVLLNGEERDLDIILEVDCDEADERTLFQKDVEVQVVPVLIDSLSIPAPLLYLMLDPPIVQSRMADMEPSQAEQIFFSQIREHLTVPL